MTRRFVLLLVAALTVLSVKATELHAPTQIQLTEMLSGNTMQGIWAGRPYIQYFAAAGATVYRERGGEESDGRWRVNEKGQYCSVWPPSDRWVCYDVLISGDNIYWKSGDEFYPAEVKPGKQF